MNAATGDPGFPLPTPIIWWQHTMNVAFEFEAKACHDGRILPKHDPIFSTCVIKFYNHRHTNCHKFQHNLCQKEHNADTMIRLSLQLLRDRGVANASDIVAMDM